MGGSWIGMSRLLVQGLGDFRLESNVSARTYQLSLSSGRPVGAMRGFPLSWSFPPSPSSVIFWSPALSPFRPTRHSSSYLTMISAVTRTFGRRAFSTSRASLSKVVVLGAAGGIGQPLGLLLKQNPLVTELALYDIRGCPGVAADVAHINTPAVVSFFPISGYEGSAATWGLWEALLDGWG